MNIIVETSFSVPTRALYTGFSIIVSLITCTYVFRLVHDVTMSPRRLDVD